MRRAWRGPRIKNFRDKFAIDENTGSFKYRADACAHRHDVRDKDNEHNDKCENWMATSSWGKLEWRKELNNIARVTELMPRVGRKLMNTETLEGFILEFEHLLYV